MVDDLEQGIDVANGYAAEHLEVQTADPERVASKIINAGAIFVGPWSPVSLGDYCAGSTHVLPTGRSACHSSGLNVRSFLKMVQVVSYTQAAFAEVARKVEVFADAEDLPAHGAAIARRFFPSPRVR
jgi:histidinol dehydrogenase